MHGQLTGWCGQWNLLFLRKNPGDMGTMCRWMSGSATAALSCGWNSDCRWYQQTMAPQEQLLKLGSKTPRIFWNFKDILENVGQISPADLGQRVSVHSPQTYLHMSPFLSLMSTGVPCMWGRAEYYCQDLPRRSEGRIFVLKCWKCNDLFDSEKKRQKQYEDF